MNKRFQRPIRKVRRIRRLGDELPLPPPEVIDDWLKRDRQKRDNKRQQPAIHLPTRNPEKEPDEKEREAIIPLIEPEQD